MLKHGILSAALFFTLLFASCSTTGKLKIIEETESQLKFIDYRGNIVEMEIPSGIEKCQYNKKLFKIPKNGKATYKGDKKFTFRRGLDISRHDGSDIDWKQVKNDGWDFIIFRIGYRGYQTGILHVDEHFHKNIQGAMQEGFDIGVYVFSQAINEEEALEEADLVLQELKDYKITLPVCFDPESIPWEEARTDNITREQFTANTIAFCEKIKAAGYEPMIYANLIWQAKYLDFEQLQNYKIWYADYRTPPLSPYHFEYWQYAGEKVQVPGIKGKVDADLMMIPVKID